MNLSLPNFLDATSPEFDEAAAIDVACEIAGAFSATLDEDECELWVDEVVPRVWNLLERELLEGQLNLFEDWSSVVAGLPSRLLSKLPDKVRRDVPHDWPASWKRRALNVALDELAGVPWLAPTEERFEDQLPVARPVAKTGVSDRRELVPVPQVPALSGLALLKSLPAWSRLLPAARAVFVVIYRRAERRTNPARPWCQVSVGLLMKVTGYKSRQVEKALAQLRGARWIGYVEVLSRDGRVIKLRGRPGRGGSRYWVVTSPAQLGVRLTAQILAELGFKI